MIEDGYLTHIPSKTTFHRAWQQLPVHTMQTWIRRMGYEIAIHSDTEAAIDSSGFEMITGQFWRYAKWGKGRLSKTSKAFRKVHLIIGLPSRAIISIANTKSKVYDSKACGKLFKTLRKPLLRQLRRLHGDKAYWHENIFGWLNQNDIVGVVPPKSNSKNHGTNSCQDQIVIAMQKYPGLSRYNHRPQRRLAVEHVFGLVKLKPMIFHDRRLANKIKSLLCHFVWYNHELLIRRMEV